MVTVGAEKSDWRETQSAPVLRFHSTCIDLQLGNVGADAASRAEPGQLSSTPAQNTTRDQMAPENTEFCSLRKMPV